MDEPICDQGLDRRLQRISSALATPNSPISTRTDNFWVPFSSQLASCSAACAPSSFPVPMENEAEVDAMLLPEPQNARTASPPLSSQEDATSAAEQVWLCGGGEAGTTTCRNQPANEHSALGSHLRSFLAQPSNVQVARGAVTQPLDAQLPSTHASAARHILECLTGPALGLASLPYTNAPISEPSPGQKENHAPGTPPSIESHREQASSIRDSDAHLQAASSLRWPLQALSMSSPEPSSGTGKMSHCTGDGCAGGVLNLLCLPKHSASQNE